MVMTVKHMFGALALSGVALLAGCGGTLDPQAPQFVQPVAATLPQATSDEALTASTSIGGSSLNSAHGFDVPVKGVQACLNAAKEHTYRTDRDTTTSCIGSDGLAHARFSCTTHSGSAITCRPF